MFQDEGRFGRINDPRRCWAPQGVRPQVAAQIVREFTYVYAAVSPWDGAMDSLILPEANTESMLYFLEEISARYPDEFILMYMDQAGWHKSAALAAPANMRVAWLPTYSPQCNPTEHIWDEVREKWFANIAFNSMKAVESTLVEALTVLEDDPYRIQGLTGFLWIINAILNAT